MPAAQPSCAMPAPMVPAPTTPRITGRGTRAALLHEGGHALDAVLGRHRQLEEAALLLEPGAERGLIRRQHRLLAEAHSQRWASGHHGCQLHRGVQPLPGRRHAVHEAEPLGLRGVDAAPGQHQLHRALLADHPGQPLGAAAAGNDPEQDLGLAEWADSEATIMSQASASSHPPPSA